MEEKRRRLYEQIREWNELRLDLFALSEPNLDLEFFGVMRFYFQDELQEHGEKISTKCIRVSSTASARDVLATLVEKFRPDIRMLTASQYALYEVHDGQPERRLQDWECPLLVQLNWGKDDLEGRVLMKREATFASLLDESKARRFTVAGLNRKLSRREKKDQEKKEKDAKLKGKENDPGFGGTLYNELPESALTRSISNPEMVMRRRRQVKLEKKLQQIRTSDGGPESGGTLKIYGGAICPEVPYKTLLLSEGDRADFVVKETLEKYGLSEDNPNDYCLVQVITAYRSDDYHADPAPKEYILNDDDLPLQILIHTPANLGQVMYQLRHRPPGARRGGTGDSRQGGQRLFQLPPGSPFLQHSPIHPVEPYTSLRPEQLPFLLEINADGTELAGAQSFIIPINGLEVGRERRSPPGISHLLLRGTDVCPRHCVMRYADTAMTLARLDVDASVSVNGARIHDTIILRHSDVILIGSGHFLRVIDPSVQRQNVAGGLMAGKRLAGDVPSGGSPAGRMPKGSGESQGLSNVVSSSLLPATVEFREDSEDTFISEILSESAVASAFKLTPTYIMYMAVRHLLTSRRDSERLNGFLVRSTGALCQTTMKQSANPHGLAVWMANASELLHFLCRDRDLESRSGEARQQLARGVQLTFRSLVNFLRADLDEVLPAFLNPRDDPGDFEGGRHHPPSGPTVGDVVEILASVISLLLRSRVNAALTIQLFSALFHHINQWLFNRLVDPSHGATLCTLNWGRRLTYRLGALEVWAEHQGLELAAECHLARVAQAARLLGAAKASADDIAGVCAACFKLNSLQIAALLENYAPGRGEARIAPDLIRRAVLIARSTADAAAADEGQEVALREDPQLRLPFLLPEDGYSCEFIRGIPDEVVAFIQPLAGAGLCRLVAGPPRSELWTAYFDDGVFPVDEGDYGHLGVQESTNAIPPGVPRVPEISVVTFLKLNGSLGLSIVAAMADGRTRSSIYVKSVVPGGAASRDGRVQAGDLLLEVDGQNLEGLSQEEAAALMGRAGPAVTMKVKHRGAVYDGLTMLLDQSPSSAGGVARYATPMGNQGSGQNGPHRAGQNGPYQPLGQNGPYQQPMQNSPYKRPGSDGPYQQPGQNGPYQQPGQNSPYQQPGSNGPYQPVGQNGPYQSVGQSGPNQPAISAAPSGGRYSKLPMTSLSKSTPNLDAPTRYPAIVPGSQQNRDDVHRSRGGQGQPGNLQPVTLLRATHNLDRDGAPRSTADRRSATLSIRSPQYPYKPTNGSRPHAPVPQQGLVHATYEQDPRNRPSNAPARIQQPVSITVPRSSVSQPYSASNYAAGVPDRQSYQSRQPYASQPNLSSGYQGAAGYQGVAGYQGAGYPLSQGSRAMPAEPTLDHRQQERPRSTGFNTIEPAVSQIGRPLAAAAYEQRFEEQQKSAGGMNSYHAPPPAGQPSFGTGMRFNDTLPKGFVATAAEEPQYAKVAPRGPRSQSVPRAATLQPRSAMSSTELLARPTTPSASPWLREERENELKREEVEMRARRADEICDLESRAALSVDDSERLRRLKLEADFDRRLEEVSSRGDDPRYDDTEVTPAGRANLVRLMQEDLEARRLSLERGRLSEAARSDQQRQDWQGRRLEEFERGTRERKEGNTWRLDRGDAASSAAPVPPKRKSSYDIYRAGDTWNNTEAAQMNNKKSVSFTPDAGAKPQPVQGRQQAGYPYVEQSGNFRNQNFGRPAAAPGSVFQSESPAYRRENSNSSGPPTPGVVGAQELYQDPRDRRMVAGRLGVESRPTPERMSFRDKMRHFAAEAGEDTPGDKAKNSRAQRVLEAEMNGR